MVESNRTGEAIGLHFIAERRMRWRLGAVMENVVRSDRLESMAYRLQRRYPDAASKQYVT